MVFEHSGIQREPDEGKTEQADTDVTKPAIRHEPEQRDNGETFERPTERDPFAIELDRENQRDEKQGRRALPGKARIAGSSICVTLPDEKPKGDHVWKDESSGSEAV